MFDYRQTFVCMQANNRLATGKRYNGALIVPQRIPYRSSTGAIWFRRGALIKSNVRSNVIKRKVLRLNK